VRTTIGQELDLRFQVWLQGAVQGRARGSLEVSDHLIAEAVLHFLFVVVVVQTLVGSRGVGTFLNAVSMATHLELEPATVPLAYLSPRLTIAGWIFSLGEKPGEVGAYECE
jgi:hypothetical protein